MSAPGHRHEAAARGRLRHLPARAVVVGAGVAGLEACLALRALAGDRVQTTLLAPNRYLAYRPAGVRDPLAVHARVREPVALVARAARAELRHDRLAAVDPDARRISTAGGYEIPYDALIVCAGGRPVPVPPGAEPFDEEHVAGCRVLMHRLRTGRVRSLALVAPPAPARVFDLYDLALEAAATVRREHVAAELALVTAEPAPLAVLGARAAALLGGMLAAQAIEVV